MKIKELVKAHNSKLTEGKLSEPEIDSVKARLVTAGFTDTLSPSDLIIVIPMLNDIISTMRKTNQSLDNYKDTMMAMPRAMREEVEAFQNGEIQITLVNGKKARFDPRTMVVTPIKVTSNS